MRRYYKKNRAYLIKKQSEYRSKNIETVRESNRQYAKNNKEKVSVLTRKWVVEKKLEIIKKLGSVCRRCKFPDLRALQVHHKKEKTKTGRRDYLVKGYNLRKVELICANCHAIEHSEFFKKNRLKYV